VRWLESLARRPHLAAVGGALCIAFSGIFYRFAETSPSTATVFRCLYGLPILLFVARGEARRYGPLPRRTLVMAAIAGLFFAGDLTSWHHAIEFVGAGLATVMGNLQVVVVALVAWAVLGERPANRTLVAIPIVLGGAVLISGVVGSGAYGKDPLLGVAIGLVTALCYAGYLLVIRRSSPDPRRIAGPVAVSTFATGVAGAVFGVLSGELVWAPSWPEHGWLLAYGLTSQSLGYLLISVSLSRLPAALTSVILLTQPVATVLLARVLLAELPSPAQLLGVALIVGGIAFATVPFARLRDRVAEARA
jgi:drug/metabolite transporter (DMT)-like permease